MKLLLLCSLHFAKGKNVSHPGLTKDNKFFGATIDKPGAFLIASVLGTNERLISISEQLLQTNQTFQHLTLAKAEEIYDIALYPLSNIGTFYFNWVEKGVIDITQEDFVKLGDRNDPKQCIQFFNKKKRSMSFLFKNKKNIFFIISDEEVGFYLDYNPLIDQKNEIDELVSQLKSSAKALKEHKITYKETLIQLTTIGSTTASGAGNVAGVVLKPPKAIAQKPFESKQRERVPNNTQIQAGSNVDDRKEDLDEEEPRQRESIQETLAQEPINRRIKKYNILSKLKNI